MSIDIQREHVLTLAEATQHVPRRRGGKHPHFATLWRWAQRGCRGVVLETIMVGGTRCTSIEALQRFFDALTAAAGSAQPQPEPTPRARSADHRRAVAELSRAGI